MLSVYHLSASDCYCILFLSSGLGSFKLSVSEAFLLFQMLLYSEAFLFLKTLFPKLYLLL